MDRTQVGIVLVLFLLLIPGGPGCDVHYEGEEAGSEYLITASDIDVVAFDIHPFFADHRRRLEVIGRDGTLDEHELYSDAGSGSSAFLYERDRDFVVIDCNGIWFSIGKEDGEIEVLGWNWEEEPPEGFVGEFVADQRQQYFLKNRDVAPDIDEIYEFKDPALYGDDVQ